MYKIRYGLPCLDMTTGERKLLMVYKNSLLYNLLIENKLIEELPNDGIKLLQTPPYQIKFQE